MEISRSNILHGQSWIGSPDDNPVGHSEAIVHILNCIASNGWTGHFENQLFVTLAVSIVSGVAYIASSHSQSGTNRVTLAPGKHIQPKHRTGPMVPACH